ncbi:protein IcmG (DotF) [Legionella lansingensis]|uniref:Protein IcmG (DotF) n=1 Tax=Legionella lansingensis TaxID=45067 RepID=A0A0W0VGT2_9GAMM|nr:type IVB secretion system protein IcmG/DotF [Legionella lansingensis]KTD19358.1 protein IcmG (DotF) [Legionella lansingensis]SNV53019.1 protein IcmG (DotF) [Legionella lansingensis]
MAEDEKDEYGGDEYQFSDLDAIEPDQGEEPTKKTMAPEGQPGSNLRRNAVIAIVVIVIVMLAYKFLTPVFTKKTQPDVVPPLTTATTQPITPPPQVQPIPVTPTPVPTVQPVTTDTTQITQRLSVLEANQESLRSQMESLNNQLGAINSNINQLAAKLAQLNQTFTVLAAQVEQQSKELTILTVRAKPKVVKRVVVKTPPPTYFLQAVIPGRAWLIAQNGSTITVREGSQIAGYGVVKLIDSRQGKVITSSGRVIRFSQQDS